ncbi:Glycosyltransferase involved in cell wall bisynthesis [Chitinophaga sp. YR627]|uniref:glycosyltransferase family 4 protein n=1 Tax=Chitinophaga sp. YR627 TaxID=1881041 RepID=UPI0008E06816|nr:glycosyltransferase family 4 protein [Chitinophaga sp. YR627]SFM96527.1 Glycosyltransferase involved in cell wall bisynthesis [Chitinophaga sp. YR627]
MNKIIAVHLHNDRHGNTMVFRQSLETLTEKGLDVHLITNRTGDTPGFLSGIPGVQYHYINYLERGNKWRIFFSFLLAQMVIFRKVWGLLEPEAKVYINTLLPFGAAWAGRLKKAPITYHIHETAIDFPKLRSFLLNTARRTATQVVFGSRYLQAKFSFPKAEKHIVHSCLPQSFVQEAVLHANHGSRKTVLMIAPLEKESGLPELLELANQMSSTKFELVIDASQKEIDAYFSNYFIPDNLMVYGTQLNLHPFYQRAAVVLNLSNTEHYQDTFDFNILQAMSYGRPVIVPLAGGANELVAHGWNGYRISGNYIDKVRKHVEQLLSNKPLYADMSCAAQLVAFQFKPEFFKQQVEDLFADGTYFTPRKKEQLAEVLLYPAALQEYINNARN